MKYLRFSTVQCTATDDATNVASSSFTVEILTASQMTGVLIDDINALLASGRISSRNANGLIRKLQNVIKQLSRDNLVDACSTMDDFNNQVSAYMNSGK